MRVHLVAVQAELDEGAYGSAESFSSWIRDLSDRAAATMPDDGAPALIAFPEAIGMPLLFGLDGAGSVRPDPTLRQAAWAALRAHWQEVLAAVWRYRAPGPAAAHLARALEVYRAYVDAFRAAAASTGATVVAGTAFLPAIDEEAARGAHVTARRVYNVAYTFAPGGRLLGRTRKAFLTPGLESRIGLSRGRVEDLRVMRAPCGDVGVAVCLDGWYDSVVSALDAQGAQLVVQPSANAASWTRHWPPDPERTEGEAWLALGLRAQLQGRLHLRYGVNPMLVGSAYGFEAQGRSSIVANAGLVRHAWVDEREGVVALAPTPDREAIVSATVELPEAARSLERDGRMRP